MEEGGAVEGARGPSQGGRGPAEGVRGVILTWKESSKMRVHVLDSHETSLNSKSAGSGTSSVDGGGHHCGDDGSGGGGGGGGCKN